MPNGLSEDEVLTEATRAALHRILDEIDQHIGEIRDVLDQQDEKLSNGNGNGNGKK